MGVRRAGRRADPDRSSAGVAADWFAFALRIRRVGRSLQPSDVADAAGVSASTYVAIESGEVVPTLDTAARIAYALDRLCGRATSSQSESLGRMLLNG